MKLAFLLIALSFSPAMAGDAPPANMLDHRKWASSAKTFKERITRLEGFWKHYLPREEGGTGNLSDGYGDASHIIAIRSCAWELARAYVETGDKEKTLAMLTWIQKYDSRSMLNAGEATPGKVAPAKPAKAGG